MSIKQIIENNAEVRANTELLETLKSTVPQFFDKDGNFNSEKFATELNENNIAEARDGYRLSFVGKDYARLQTGRASETLIQPDIAHNSKKENVDSQNIFITGDNLEALRHLQNAYAGKVKMIYIDPPYNTGKEFVYNDRFEFADENLKAALGYSDEEVARLKSIQGKSSHSAWLTFMYPRLKLAQKLLTDDGVIFVSIDDNEQANLKLLMDDVWGEGNFVVAFPRVTKKGGKSSDATAKNHDYILMYAKNINNLDIMGVLHDDAGYCNKDEYFETRGYYKCNQTLDYDSLGWVKSLDYPIEIEGKVFYAGGSKEKYEERQNGQHGRADWGWRWRWGKYEFGRQNGFIVVKNGGNRPRIYTKTYQNVKIEKVGDKYEIVEFDRTKPLSTLEFTENKFSNDNAKKSIDEVMERGLFEYTKPPELIIALTKLVNDEDFYILDFFAGSATTAHAAMQLNAEDNGNRKYIMVQLDEQTNLDSEARKAGYKTIDEISRERIKRAAAKIKSENPMLADKMDLGFKHYRLATPATTTLDKITEFSVENLFSVDMISEMGGLDTILTTWLVDGGNTFDTKITEVVLSDYVAHYVADSKTLYLISERFSTEALKAMLNKIGTSELAVSTIVIYSYSFGFEIMRELEIGVKMLDNAPQIIKKY